MSRDALSCNKRVNVTLHQYKTKFKFNSLQSHMPMHIQKLFTTDTIEYTVIGSISVLYNDYVHRIKLLNDFIRPTCMSNVFYNAFYNL